MTYRSGQKMICVDDSPLIDGRAHPFPRGTVMTIERIGNCSFDCVGFKFFEADLLDGRAGYCSLRWRPVIERKADISFAHAILRKVSEKEPA